MAAAAQLSVLVLGAGGYIGEAVAVALRRCGHRIVGVVRSEKQAERLVSLEVQPLLAKQPNEWIEHAARCDAVIDAIGFFEGSDAILLACREASRRRMALGGEAKKLLFLFASGIMVYGDALSLLPSGAALNESIPPHPRPGELHGEHRLVHERRVQEARQELHPVVIRPGWVYGGSGGPYISWFFGPPAIDLPTNTVNLVGSPDKRWSWVHVEDLADAFVRCVVGLPADARAAARPDLPRWWSGLAGEVFNVVSGEDHPTFLAVHLAAARLAGLQNTEPGGTPRIVLKQVEESKRILEDSVVIVPARATEVLAWQPRHRGFLEEFDVYYHAWRLREQRGGH